MLRLPRNDPEVITAWTDTGTREVRQLKHRARGEVRCASRTPQLAEHLRHYLDTYGTGTGGRLFVGPRGAAVKESVYTDVWQAARCRVLGPDADTSPLARRPLQPAPLLRVHLARRRRRLRPDRHLGRPLRRRPPLCLHPCHPRPGRRGAAAD